MSKKIFLIWADNGLEIVDMINNLYARSHQVLYWVGLKENTSSHKDIIFHDHYAAWGGEPAPTLSSKNYTPPSKELLYAMRDCESTVLTMMDKRFDSISTNERKHIYYRMLGYWAGVLDEFKPDIILFPTVPHSVYNYIIYMLGKHFGIQTLMFEDSWVSDRLLTYQDYEKGSELFQKAILKNKEAKFTLDDLEGDIKDYYVSQTNPKSDATPIYMKHWKNKFSRTNIFKANLKKAVSSLRDLSIFKKIFKYLLNSRKMNLMKEYAEIVKNPDLSINFIYVPLNFQPERTTSPQGDVYVDQLLMIETLSFALPKNFQIYVKEHPSQWWLRGGARYGSARYPGFYSRIARLQNVSLVPIETDTYTLIEKSKAVATVTGTAGWEALLRGKPTLIFGYPWYRDYPEVMRIGDYASAKTALEKIEKGFIPQKQTMINFLKSFDDSTIHGYIEGFVEKNSKLSKKESMNNILEEIKKAII